MRNEKVERCSIFCRHVSGIWFSSCQNATMPVISVSLCIHSLKVIKPVKQAANQMAEMARVGARRILTDSISGCLPINPPNTKNTKHSEDKTEQSIGFYR